MKVMISQPMNGKKESQIRLERQKVIKILEDLGWQVIDTIFTDEAPKSCNPAIYYLSRSIKEISKVDAVMFMNGWEKARGCRIEHDICLYYEILTMYEYEL
jgi:hypothetical protein|nr:MAG TPA: Nucleoside 2-deoxyribosyltransferase like protein [Caudoviricetes sp.]